MMTDYNPTELLNRIRILEEGIGGLQRAVNTTSQTVATLDEQVNAANTQQFGHQNHVRNGDFDYTRNNYLYTTDFVGGGGVVSADVSEEAAHWFVSVPDTSVETTGSIAATDNTLTIDTPDFVSADAVGNVEVVVEGAGTAGADLITTIATFTDASNVELTAAGITTVSNARVRFRLLTLKEDSTDIDADADQTTNTALKTSAHSRYADSGIINNPDYDKENGWVRVSDTNWLCAPFQDKYFKPSKQWILSFIYKLANDIDGADSYLPNILAGIWDNSSGQKKFLEGMNPTLSAIVEGTPSATVSREYFVVMYNDWDASIGTSKITLANAPSDASYVTGSVYVYLNWAAPVGVVRTEVYMKSGGVTKLLRTPYPQKDYKDNGTSLKTVSDYPAVDYTRTSALIKTTERNFREASSNEWRLAQFNITIPSDYSQAATTDKQWFVWGLQEALSGSGATRALLVDAISVDDKLGTFTKCPLDFFAKRPVSSTPTSGNQGTTTTGGGTGIPPSGTGHCPVFESMIEVSENSEIKTVPALSLLDNQHRYKIVNTTGGLSDYTASLCPKQTIYTLTTTDGFSTSASELEPIIQTASDIDGKLLKNISFGDNILTKSGVRQAIGIYCLPIKKHVIRITLQGAEKSFWADGVALHNKIDPNEL